MTGTAMPLHGMGIVSGLVGFFLFATCLLRNADMPGHVDGPMHPRFKLVSLLTIADVMHEGEKIISVSYRSLEVYLAIAFIYLMLTSITTLILRRTEKVLRADGRV